MSQYPTKIVSGLLQEEDAVLLCFRKNTSDFSEHWALPVGHCEQGENETDTLRRELFEEIGIQLIDAEFFTRLFDNAEGIEHAVYRVLDWRGGIQNCEPEYCDEVGWFLLSQLPEPLTPATKRILESLE